MDENKVIRPMDFVRLTKVIIYQFTPPYKKIDKSHFY